MMPSAVQGSKHHGTLETFESGGMPSTVQGSTHYGQGNSTEIRTNLKARDCRICSAASARLN